MLIETREELINALMDGAELEHNLACLYLFAAFSIKDRAEELLNVPENEREDLLNNRPDGLIHWKNEIFNVALEEMGHLGTVSNLLTLIGAEAHFDRPNFPPAEGYYPPDEKIVLARFSRATLERFVEFERNKDQPGVEALGIAPRGIAYKHVGELYAAILKAFQEIDANDPAAGGINIRNEDLFQGYRKAMDKFWSSAVHVHDFGLRRNPPPSVDELRKEVRDALADVIEEGEGATDPLTESHYEKFLAIYRSLRTREMQFPGFEAARNVATNPMTQQHRGAGADITLITSKLTKDAAELFNSFYGSLLLALRQTYAFSEDLSNESRLNDMQRVSKQIMKRALAPLGEALTRLPVSDSPTSEMAGPGFELYRPLYVSSQPDIAWSVIRERLVIAQREAERLESETGAAQDSDIASVFRTAGRMAGQLVTVIEQKLITS